MAYDPDRPITTCLGCGAADGAPKHQQWLQDGSTVYWHMDCHVHVRNCAECEAVLDTTPGGFGDHLKDEELLAHFMNPETQTGHEIFTTDNAHEYAAAAQAAKRFGTKGVSE